MNKEEFLKLAWRLEELMMKADLLRREVGNCGGQCDGLDGMETVDLCQPCSDVFEKLLEEDDKLAENKEFNDVLAKLQQACKADKSGEYDLILRQFRGGGVKPH